MQRTLCLLTLASLLACVPANSPTPAPQVSPLPGASASPSSNTPTSSPSPDAVAPTAQPNPSSSALPSPSGAGASASPGTGEGAAAIEALRLETSTRFLSANGQRVQLNVRDQNGQPIAPERLSFVSSRPQDLSVDAQGNVEARVNDGFSTITVRLKSSYLSAEQLFSVSSPLSGGGGGSSNNTPAGPTQENVNGQIEFQF